MDDITKALRDIASLREINTRLGFILASYAPAVDAMERKLIKQRSAQRAAQRTTKRGAK